MHIYDRNFNYITETKNNEQIQKYKDIDYIITDFLYANPIQLEDGSLREATKEELYAKGQYNLIEGEKFQDEKIILVPCPSKYHIWKENDWTVNLADVKKIKREELKKIRTQKQNEDFEFNGHLFQATEKDMRNIETKYNAITMLDKLGQDIKPYLAQKIKWTLKNNTQIELLVSDILQLYIAWDNRRTEVFNYCNNVLYKQLEDATTVEEIEAITWE